ncbi:MAG: hypothetical protein E7Z92_01400 [Cyanobacteria bacterium SIG31]|nr:hypothetical protein [Cyanobacteria bacterium SIG31]
MRFNFKVEDIKYVKILYKDHTDTPATVKGGIKRISEREILVCTKFIEELLLINPQEVVISFICSDGLYRTKTFLKSIENAEPYILLVLQTPQGMEYEQNREYFRVSVEYDCTCEIKDNENIKELNGKTIDLSANGICAKFSTPFLSASEVNLKLYIENRVIELASRIVRNEIAEDNTFKASFAFTKVLDSDRDFISQICIKKQLEQKRNSLY